MPALWPRKRVGPIGIDLGSRSVKLVQLAADGSQSIEAARWDLPEASTDEVDAAGLATILRQAREGRRFRGKDAAICLGWRDLFVQNIRVNRTPNADLAKLVQQEAEGRLPFPAAETELRFLEAGDVRQGDAVRREVLVFASHRPRLERLLEAVELSGLKPVAVEVEPLAVLRCYYSQFRREEDKTSRVVYVHVGHAKTCIMIAQGPSTVFVKYIELGGKHLDEALARHSNMDLGEAWALRRHNGDRRADQQDAEVTASIAEASRPIVDRLVQELSLCIRYHNVTFRGQPLKRAIVGGGEATLALSEMLATKLQLPCELGDPWRTLGAVAAPGRKSQWDVAMGLALRGSQTPSEVPAAAG
jgi:type IV pilus assembly protein PilM